MTLPKNRLSRYEIIGYVLIVSGAVVLIWGTVKFNLMHELYLDPADRKGGVFGEFGEFIGGIVGSLWALAGVFLFFATLTYQKREFELQRYELHKTQKIFQQQNFSTLYISFINKHNALIDSLVAYDINQSPRAGSNFFVFFQEKVLSSFVQKVRGFDASQKNEVELHHLFQEYFTYHFTFYQNSLDPYLKNLSILFRLIQRYQSDTSDEGEYYSFITKAGFTQSELFLIYHVAKYRLLAEFNAFDDTFNVFEYLLDDYRVSFIVEKELGNSKA